MVLKEEVFRLLYEKFVVDEEKVVLFFEKKEFEDFFLKLREEFEKFKGFDFVGWEMIVGLESNL